MAIFGRSSKKATPPSPPSQTIYNSQQHLQGSYVTSSQSSWTLVEQRPDASFNGDGSDVAQSQGWTGSAYQVYNQPVFVSNNYLVTPPLPERPQKAGSDGKKVKKMQSFSNLLAGDVPSYIPGARVFNESQDIPRYIPGARIFNDGGTQYLNQAAALHDIIASKFNAIVTQIDGESFSGDDRELAVFAPPAPLLQQQQQPEYNSKEFIKGKSKGMTNNAISSALTSTNYFAKVNLYANSRLPPNLPPMKIYLPTYTLLCLAAQYSERVYTKPTGKEKETHVEADWRLGTKAMVIKSVPMDDMNTIVFAIRGTQTFLDWAVNLNSAPASPEGFLDDPGNHCHAGFLTVARKMIKPVAAHLRHLLEEDPSRSKCSLLITGHSAGGAVAALLYSHMLSTSKAAESELTILAGFFKRIHCVSFGAPPISLLPLEKPKNPALRKSIFYSFVNEGDPVARADKAYIRSLLDLYSSPAPGQSCLSSVTPQRLQPLVATLHSKSSNAALKENKASSSTLTLNKLRPSAKTSKSAPASTEAPPMPFWPVPEATLSNAGRIIVLRSVERYETRPNRKKQVNERMDEGVVAQMVSDQLLRGVVWGDPVCHMMRLYARRIEVLATNAIMGR